MLAYLQRMSHKFSLFDAPLVYNFSAISKTEKADLTKVFDNTLVKYEPYNAVVSFSRSASIPKAFLKSIVQPHSFC